MARLEKITSFLDSTLCTRQVPDSSFNGLQNQGTGEVEKIAFAVDACLQTFKLAAQEGAQMLIAHHGLYWKNSPIELSRTLKQRLMFLSQNHLSLYASHLPLDLHPVLGNNAQLCKVLGLKKTRSFAQYAGLNIGFRGELSKALSRQEFEELLEQKIGVAQIFPFGSKQIKMVGVVSGGGAFATSEAVSLGLDAFVTGEFKHSYFHEAKEGNLNVFSCGHYETETFGLKALMPLVEKKLKVKTVFLSAPTRL